jgi:hypothetical protein
LALLSGRRARTTRRSAPYPKQLSRSVPGVAVQIPSLHWIYAFLAAVIIAVTIIWWI